MSDLGELVRGARTFTFDMEFNRVKQRAEEGKTVYLYDSRGTTFHGIPEIMERFGFDGPCTLLAEDYFAKRARGEFEYIERYERGE